MANFNSIKDLPIGSFSINGRETTIEHREDGYYVENEKLSDKDIWDIECFEEEYPVNYIPV